MRLAPTTSRPWPLWWQSASWAWSRMSVVRGAQPGASRKIWRRADSRTARPAQCSAGESEWCSGSGRVWSRRTSVWHSVAVRSQENRQARGCGDEVHDSLGDVPVVVAEAEDQQVGGAPGARVARDVATLPCNVTSATPSSRAQCSAHPRANSPGADSSARTSTRRSGASSHSVRVTASTSCSPPRHTRQGALCCWSDARDPGTSLPGPTSVISAALASGCWGDESVVAVIAMVEQAAPGMVGVRVEGRAQCG